MVNILKLLTIWVVLIAGVIIYFDLAKRGAFDHDVTIIRDSTFMPPITVNLPPGKPIIITNQVPVQVDTSAIIQAYFNEVHYNDSLVSDSVNIYLKEVVSQNAIRSRELTYRLNIPIQTVTEIHQTNRWGLLVGGFGTFHSGDVRLNVAVGYQSKRGQMYFGSYGTDGSFGVGVMYRVGR